MKLLLVEDDLEISEMLNSFLSTENFEVVVAHDGKEAYELFAQTLFDIVLLDLMIPKINGMDVMQQIRKHSIVPIMIMCCI